MRRFQNTGISRVLGRRIEVEGKRANGEIFPAEISIHRVGIAAMLERFRTRG